MNFGLLVNSNTYALRGNKKLSEVQDMFKYIAYRKVPNDLKNLSFSEVTRNLKINLSLQSRIVIKRQIYLMLISSRS